MNISYEIMYRPDTTSYQSHRRCMDNKPIYLYRASCVIGGRDYEYGDIHNDTDHLEEFKEVAVLAMKRAKDAYDKEKSR